MVKVAQKIRDAAEGGQPFFSFEFFDINCECTQIDHFW